MLLKFKYVVMDILELIHLKYVFSINVKEALFEKEKLNCNNHLTTCWEKSQKLGRSKP